MFFLNIDGAIEQLGRKGLSTRECLNYVVADFALIFFWKFLDAAFSNATARSATSFSFTNLIAPILGTLIAFGIFKVILGIYYESNGGDQGKNFLENLLVLHWLTSVRVTLVTVPSTLILIFNWGTDLSQILTVAAIFGLISFTALIWSLVATNSALKKIRVIYLEEQTRKSQFEMADL